MASISTIGVALLFIWVVKLTFDAIRNLYFSSLSAIPGPKLAAVTRLPLIKHKAAGRSEIWRVGLHREYGDVVRISPTEISFASDAVWKDIYGYAPGSQFVVLAKDPNFYGGHSIEASMIDGDDVDHNRQRKSFSPAFSDKAIRAQEPLIKGYIKQLLRNIGSNEPVNLAQQFNFTTFDIMADLAFGEPLGCLETSKYISWISMIFASLKVMTIVSELNHWPIAKSLFNRMIPASLRAKQKQHRNFSAERVEKRMSQKDTKTDIWHFVLASEEKDIRLTRAEMHANAGVFMIAGTETTATLLSALTYYLLANPDKMKQLVQEIRGRFGKAETITAQEVLSLKYLTACANEAFRMHPPVPLGLPRVVSRGGAVVGGYKLPEGTSVSVHQLSIGRNPNNFIEPDTFIPERWLSVDNDIAAGSPSGSVARPTSSTRFASDKKAALQPFSIGPRNCIGQSLAWLEIRLIMTHLLWHFDLELCDGMKGWDEQQIFHLWVSKPLMVRAKSVR